MKVSYALLLVSLAVMPLLFFVNFKVLLVYLLLWVDKLVLGLLKPVRFIGIELSTLAGALAGIFFGPVASFFLVATLYTILHSIRFLVVPFPPPDWPLFVPDRYALVYASAGIVAGLMNTAAFPITLMIAVAVKILIHAATEMALGKPVRVASFIGTAIFYAIFMIPFGLQLLALAS